MSILTHQKQEFVSPSVGAELLSDTRFALQTPEQFRDDFSARTYAATNGQRVLLEVMQFEDTADTRPIFDAMKSARLSGAQVGFHYDRVALRHIRAEGDTESQAYTYLGHNVIRFGDKQALADASNRRRRLTTELEDYGITDPAYKKRGEYPHRSHNHIKLAVVGDTAWFGTMNLRGVDFEMSNFMMKTNDPDSVDFLKRLFDKSEVPVVVDDEVFEVSGQAAFFVDGGRKGESVIYDKAVAMAESLGEDDEFILIGQWPPVRMMYGKLANTWFAKMNKGTKGKFLLSPEDKLHPSRPLSIRLQNWVKQAESAIPNMTTVNLARPTHAKALLIRRANGESEVMFGSHNFTKWTVKNGTKELAMWTNEPDVVAQVEDFLARVEAE